jgi:hypothetical protein
VTAIDASLNSTGGTSQSTLVGCASLSPTNYNLITVTAAVGAITCNIYRTAGGAGVVTGLIANIPCGAGVAATYLDTTNTHINSSSAPSNNGTGGLAASGSITGLNFLATGTAAGTSDWVQGSALPLCAVGTQPQPCIQPYSFFLQAPTSGITNSFGWTAPSATNTATGPVIAAGSSGTPPASTLSIGTLTDPTNSTLATASGTFSSASQGDFASITYSSPNADFTDSRIASYSMGAVGSNIAYGGIFLPSIINPLSAGAGEAIGTTPIVVQFISPYKITVNHVTPYVTASSSNNLSVGVYTSAGAQVFAVSLSCATAAAATSTSVSSAVMQPGTYYLAYVAGDSTCKVSGVGSGNSGSAFLNENHASVPRIGTLTGLSALPGSFTPSSTSITANAENIIFVYIEP